MLNHFGIKPTPDFSYTRHEKSYWKRHAVVPSPPINFFFGNTHELKDGQHALDQKYLKELGSTFGFVQPDFDVLRGNLFFSD